MQIQNYTTMASAIGGKVKLFRSKFLQYVPPDTREEFIERHSNDKVSWLWSEIGRPVAWDVVVGRWGEDDIDHVQQPGHFPDDYIGLVKYKDAIADYEKIMTQIFHTHISDFVSFICINPALLLVLMSLPYLRFTPAEFDEHSSALTSLLRKANVEFNPGDEFFRKSAEINIIKEDEGNVRCYYVALSAYFRQFMTGEFTWGAHNGVIYTQQGLFGSTIATQIKL